jgi:Asp-tRNA(Asn)/Glu-tRNA(Gln) amidotransferase A subunit family amidase
MTEFLDRRTFVALCTASGLGGTAFPEVLWSRLQAQAVPAPLPAGPPDRSQQAPAKVTREMVLAAETIAGLAFTDPEREMMLQNLNNALQSYERLHGLSLSNAVLPAVQFSPLLPGRKAGIPAPKPGKAPRRTVTRPAAGRDLAFLPVASLAELVRRRQVTATELTRLSLDRLTRHGPGLNCLVTLTEERALRQAAKADREIAAGRYRGPLHGIPWGAKDLLAVAGYPTTWGSPIYQEQVLGQTAAVVERLDQAGAILVAKLSLGELALGDVWYGGTTKNPWKTSEGSSGSSAGPGAATAAGLVGFSIGSETLGSIVSPSTRCGVSGLRPTFGRVSRHGAMALAWSMDKLGPMCRTIEDCALVFGAIHGPDGRDPTVHDAPFVWDSVRPLAGIRIGYLKAAFDADHPTKVQDEAALAALRARGVDPAVVELPSDLPVQALRIILNAEAAAAFDDITRDNRDEQMVRQVAGAWPNSFRSARFIPAVEYIQANRVRTQLMERMEAVFDKVDVFITPSFAANVLLATNLTGHPAAVVPNGFSAEGSPISVSFIGRLFGEAALCRVAMAWQEATGWHRKTPEGYE